MNTMVLPPPYKYSERPCDLRKVGLDTRLFTSPHTMELLRYGGYWPPSGLSETEKVGIEGNELIQAHRFQSQGSPSDGHPSSVNLY